MPTSPDTWAATAAANAKITAATAALKHADGLFPSTTSLGHIGDRFVKAFLADGMRLGLQTTLILNLIRTKSVSDYNALVTFLKDPTAVAIAANTGLAPFRGAVANTVPQAASNIANAGAAAPGAIFNGLTNATKAVDITGFLGALTSPNTWLRVAEVTLGIVLVVVGLVKLAPPGVSRNIKTVGKVAALL